MKKYRFKKSNCCFFRRFSGDKYANTFCRSITYRIYILTQKEFSTSPNRDAGL